MEKASMEIRVLRETDAKAYQALRLNGLQVNPEAFGSTYEREVQFTHELVAERIAPSPEKFVLGAFDSSGTLVGIVTFVRETSLKTAHKGNIYGMYVSPTARGQGVGASLMRELVSRARDCDGLEQLHLTVVSDNEPAKRLYRSLGFEVYGVETHALKWAGRYDDEELMVLRFG